MSLLTADALDRAEAGSQDAAALLRNLTPTLKFRAPATRARCAATPWRWSASATSRNSSPAAVCATAHLGSIWRGLQYRGLDALSARWAATGADAASQPDLHPLDDSTEVPPGVARPACAVSPTRHRFCPRGCPRAPTMRPSRGAPQPLYHVAAPSRWRGKAAHPADARRSAPAACCRAW